LPKLAVDHLSVRRTSISGRLPTTSQINVGEFALNMPDQILYSTDGTNVFPLGANNITSRASNNFYVGNSSVNVSINSSSINSSVIFAANNFYVGNTTVNVSVNSSSINSSSIFASKNLLIGNSTVNLVMNSSTIFISNSTSTIFSIDSFGVINGNGAGITSFPSGILSFSQLKGSLSANQAPIELHRLVGGI
jgi:hypothetical protein